VLYDSQSYRGFIFSASVAEAGDYWGTADIATPGVVAPANRVYRAKARHHDLGYCPIGYALATGPFVQGHYHHADFGLIPSAGLA
jgi:hypothetical protein